MKTRNIVIAAVAVTLLAAPAALVAQGAFGGPGPGARAHGPGGPGGPGLQMAMRILHRLGDYLALTDEQRTQIEGIVETARGQIQPLIEQSMAARRAFHEATQPGAFDEAGFRAHAEEMAKLQVEIKVASARAMAQVFNVLTPEQRQKLDELKGLARPMDGEGFGFRHGGGPGAGPGGV